MSKTLTDRRWNIIANYFESDKKKKVIGAEVGIWRGQMSQKLLELMPNLYLHMVDLWEVPEPGSSYFEGSIKIARSTQQEFNAAFEETKRRVRKYSERCHIMKMASIEAAKRIKDEHLDFCFLDADHSYKGVSEDIEAWLPKVRKGGILCGHDYDHPDQGAVKEAVHDLLGDDILATTNRTWVYEV